MLFTVIGAQSQHTPTQTTSNMVSSSKYEGYFIGGIDNRRAIVKIEWGPSPFFIEESSFVQLSYRFYLIQTTTAITIDDVITDTVSQGFDGFDTLNMIAPDFQLYSLQITTNTDSTHSPYMWTIHPTLDSMSADVIIPPHVQKSPELTFYVLMVPNKIPELALTTVDPSSYRNLFFSLSQVDFLAGSIDNFCTNSPCGSYTDTTCNMFAARCECTQPGFVLTQDSQCVDENIPGISPRPDECTLNRICSASPNSQNTFLYPNKECNECTADKPEEFEHYNANRTRTAMLYLAERNESDQLIDFNTKFATDHYKMGFFDILSQELTADLHLFTKGHIENANNFIESPPVFTDGGVFVFEGDSSEMADIIPIRCAEFIRAYPLSHGRGDKWSYDTVILSLHLNCDTYLDLKMQDINPLISDLDRALIKEQFSHNISRYMEQRFGWFERRLQQIFTPQSQIPPSNVRKWTVHPLLINVESRFPQIGVEKLLLFKPNHAITHTSNSARVVPTAPMLTTYCTSVIDPLLPVVPCPSTRTHETSKYWSPCNGGDQPKTLAPVCLDLNQVQYPSTQYSWCSSLRFYPKYPSLPSLDVCSQTSTETATEIPKISQVTARVHYLHQYSEDFIAGDVVSVEWDYTGPAGHTVAIYLEGIELAPRIAVQVANSLNSNTDIERILFTPNTDDDNESLFDPLSPLPQTTGVGEENNDEMNEFTQQQLKLMDESGRLYIKTVPASSKYTHIRIPEYVITHEETALAYVSVVVVQHVTAAADSSSSKQPILNYVMDCEHCPSQKDPNSPGSCDLLTPTAPCTVAEPQHAWLNPLAYDLKHAVPDCHEGCITHGECDKTDPDLPKCRCSPEYIGYTCQIKTSCQNGATPTAENGFTIPFCNDRGYMGEDVHVSSGCSTKCSCNVPGWAGDKCDQCDISYLGCSIVPNAVNQTETEKNCNKCVCNLGYAGNKCQFRAFYGSIVYETLSPIQSASVLPSSLSLESTSQALLPNTAINTTNNNSRHTRIYINTPFNSNPISAQTSLFSKLSFDFIDLPPGDNLSNIPALAVKEFLLNIAITLGLDISDVDIKRVYTLITQNGITTAKSISDLSNIGNNIESLLDNSNEIDETLLFDILQSTNLKNTTTTITFSITSSTPSSSRLPSISTSQAEPSTLDDLYHQWNDLKSNLPNTPVGASPVGDTLGSPVKISDPFDPLCGLDEDGKVIVGQKKCTTENNPFLDFESPILDFDPPRKKTSSSTIVIAVGVVIIVISLVALAAVLLWYGSKHKVWCFVPEDQKSSYGGGEVSLATNISGSDDAPTDLSAASGSSGTGSQKPTYTGGMSSDQTQQKTIDLEPVIEEGQDAKPLPPGWGKWRHKQTGEIIWINSDTMISQRHAPGEESTKKGKWF